MARCPPRNHSPTFKVKVAVAAIKGAKTLIELAQARCIDRAKAAA